MSADVIREFLVELSWRSDEAQQRRFFDGIAAATKSIVALGATIKTVEVAVIGMAQRISSGFEQLAYASSRVNASVANISSFRYAISQLGGTAEGAMQALEAFGRKLRESPGEEARLRAYGVKTRDAQGRLRDTTELIKEMTRTQKFRVLPYFSQLQIAESMGIDERTFRALLGDVDRFTREYRQKLKSAGLDPDKAAEEGKKIAMAWRSMTASIEMLVDRIMLKHGDTITKHIKDFSDWLDAHGNEIADALERVIKVLLDAGKYVADLVGKFIDFISKADPFVEKVTGMKSALSALAAVILLNLIPGVGALTTALLGLVTGAGWRGLMAGLGMLGMGGGAAAMGGAALGFGLGMTPGSAGAGEDEFARQKYGPPPPDKRNWWQRNMPKWLGGKDPPKPGDPVQGAADFTSKSFTSALGVSQTEYEAMREGIARLEGARYNQMGGSSGRFAGRYQMGGAEIAETARRLGEQVPSTQQFLSDPAMQERYFEAYTLGHHEWLMKNSPAYAALSPRQKMQVLGYAHNQGAGGAANWLATRQVGRDAFGTAGTAYSLEIARRFAALDKKSTSGIVGSAMADEESVSSRRNSFAERVNRGGSIADPVPAAAAPGTHNSFVNSIAHGHTLHAKTSITVNAASDPGATAREVANQQNRVNAETIRNLNGAAR